MSSTCFQRYYNQARENDIKYKYCGQARLLQVCLNYQNSQSPLSCIVDGDNLRNIAIQSGVKDIVTLHDDGSTELHPTKHNVIKLFKEMAERCVPGDMLVFQYSGHGSRVQDQDGDQEDGYDQVLCLTTPDGEPDDLVDDQLAEIVYTHMNPQVPCLFLMDCCHSGSLLDLSKPGVWGGGRRVVLISGCQDSQLSGDTGNGGVMTKALIAALRTKGSKKQRRKRNASIQFIFNRMVEKMPQEQEQGMEQKQMGEQEEQFWEEEGQFDWEQEGEQQHDQEPEQGQTINISWNGRADPTKIPFPF